jgi:hypothetical protein
MTLLIVFVFAALQVTSVFIHLVPSAVSDLG